MTGNSGATFSDTIGTQILVVRLSALASQAMPKEDESSPEWKWRIIDYYTTFDKEMDVSKMVLNDYIDEEDGIFGPDDNPEGY